MDVGPERTGKVMDHLVQEEEEQRVSWLDKISWKKKVLLLALIACAVYGILILLDVLLLRSWLSSSFGPASDLGTFQTRAQGLLDGKMLYRDLDVESPPLINYLLVIPQALGGEWWMYEIYFSAFSLLLSVGMFIGLKRWNERYAFISALIVLLSPFLIEEATWGVEDEPIVAFFVIMPLLLYLVGRWRSSSAVFSIGFWTKFLPVILFPVILIDMKSWRERIESLILAGLVLFLIALPFLIICPTQFLHFPTYYLMQRNQGPGGSVNTSASLSVISLLSQGNMPLPGWFGAGLTILALLIAYIYIQRKGLDVWRGSLLVFVAFLAFYPMSHLGYFIVPFALLSVWIAKDLKMLYKVVPMYVALLFAQGLAVNPFGIDPTLSWVSALALLLIGLVLLFDLTRTAIRTKCFLDG